MSLTTEQKINRMSIAVNKLLAIVQTQQEQLDEIRNALNVDLHLVDTKITMKEAGKILGLCPSAVWRRIQQGKITTAVREGNRYHMSRKEIESLKFIS